MSDPRTIDDAEVVWKPDPLLASSRSQVPSFLRTQWDENSARKFGPWRVAAPIEPTAGQTLSAFGHDGEQPPPDGEPSASEVEALPDVIAEPASPWSDAAIAALRQESWQQGLLQGLEQARQEYEAARHKEGELIRHLGIELRSLQQDPQRFFEPLKRLALHIAEQWVRGELHISGQAVEQLVRQCLEQLDPAGEKVHVDLNPADLERLKALGEQATADLELHADTLLREGSVRVRLNESVVQDLIEHRVEAMARKLLQKPESWLQQSSLIHPDKVSPVDDAQARRSWSRPTLDVQDAQPKDEGPAPEPTEAP